MALTQIVPAYAQDERPQIKGISGTERIRLTKPNDEENDLIRLAAESGPGGIFSAIRAKKDYGWFVVLGLRAIEVCISPVRNGKSHPSLEKCDAVAFSVQLLEMELIGDVFELVRHFEHMKDAQRAGLAIIELLVMDDPEWRDEIARRNGVSFLCDVAKQRKDSPRIMCQVMMCMAYLAAENYIEVMLCQHEALEYVAYVLRRHPKNAELMTRASLALLNLTCCEPHVEEVLDKQALPSIIQVMENHATDVHVIIILSGVLANLSVHSQAQEQLVELDLFRFVRDAMQLDASNAILQIACLKAIVNYSTNAEFYVQMDTLTIPKLVTEALIEHSNDAEVQRYGNYFLGNHTTCIFM